MKRRLLMKDIPVAWTSGRHFMETVERWFPGYEPQPWNSNNFEISQKATASRDRNMQSDDAMLRWRASGNLGRLAVPVAGSHVWRKR